jgi:hypothetical protein
MRIIPSSGLLKGSQQNQGQDEQVMDACTQRDSVTIFLPPDFFQESSSLGTLIIPFEPFQFFPKITTIFAIQGAAPMPSTPTARDCLHPKLQVL